MPKRSVGRGIRVAVTCRVRTAYVVPVQKLLAVRQMIAVMMNSVVLTGYVVPQKELSVLLRRIVVMRASGVIRQQALKMSVVF